MLKEINTDKNIHFSLDSHVNIISFNNVLIVTFSEQHYVTNTSMKGLSNYMDYLNIDYTQFTNFNVEGLHLKDDEIHDFFWNNMMEEL